MIKQKRKFVKRARKRRAEGRLTDVREKLRVKPNDPTLKHSERTELEIIQTCDMHLAKIR